MFESELWHDDGKVWLSSWFFVESWCEGEGEIFLGINLSRMLSIQIDLSSLNEE